MIIANISANLRLDENIAKARLVMKYYKRHIEDVVKKVKKQFPVTLITGPRQVGKSTLLRHISNDEYQEVSFDDPIIRLQAENDPNLFIKNNPPPIILDEIQYVPGIFP